MCSPKFGSVRPRVQVQDLMRVQTECCQNEETNQNETREIDPTQREGGKVEGDRVLPKRDVTEVRTNK